jgi:LysM repeat protein
MKKHSPLVPQGSLLEKHAQRRPNPQIIFLITAAHVIFIGGVLLQGCKKDTSSDNGNTSLTNNVVDLNSSTNQGYMSNWNELPDPVTKTNILDGGNALETNTVDSSTNLVSDPPFDPVSDDTEEITPPPDEEEAVTPPTTTTNTTYTVVQGDSFWGISRKFKVTVQAIRNANPDVIPEKIQPGQVLQIPPAPPETPAIEEEIDGTRYTVQRGDTLTEIARKHGVTIEDIKQANNMSSSLILAGKELIIPPKKEE